MRKSSAVTVDSVRISNRWNRFAASCDQQTCRTRACCAISCGRIPTKTPWGGERTTAAWVSHSELRYDACRIIKRTFLIFFSFRLWQSFWPSMISIWSVALIKLWKTATSSSRSVSWWRCSPLPITAASLITRVNISHIWLALSTSCLMLFMAASSDWLIRENSQKHFISFNYFQVRWCLSMTRWCARSRSWSRPTNVNFNIVTYPAADPSRHRVPPITKTKRNKHLSWVTSRLISFASSKL